MLNKMCSAVANPVAEAMSPVNNQVQNIVNNHAVNLYVSILATVLCLVSVMLNPRDLGNICQTVGSHFEYELLPLSFLRNRICRCRWDHVSFQ